MEQNPPAPDGTPTQPLQPQPTPIPQPKADRSPAETPQAPQLPSRTPRSVIVFLLLVFPPLAWILMAIDKTYHHWLVKILGISGVLTLAFLLFFYVTVVMQLSVLYEQLGISDAADDRIFLFGGTIAVLQILLSLYLHHFLKKHLSLTLLQLIIVSLLFFAALAVALIPPLLTIQNIYSISPSI